MADTSSTELQTQLDLQNQITQVLQSRLGILKAQEKALTNQVQLAVDMCKALKCEELEDISDRLENMRKEMEKAAQSATDMGTQIEDAAEEGVKSTEQLSSGFNKIAEEVDAGNGAIAGFAVGLLRGLGSAFQTITNLATATTGLVGTFFNLGTALLSVPFKLYENLLGMGNTGGGGPSPIRLELENIRKEFGSLSKAMGATAKTSLQQFRKEAANLAGTGIPLRRIFGSGPEGIAKAMAENLELIKALGPAAANFTKELENNVGVLTAYRKGLGLTTEQQAKFMKLAYAAGNDPMKAMDKFASQAINMGDAFNLSSKDIAKDMADMQADFGNFGGLGTKVMSQISVYTRKLGIEVKSLTGLIDGFDNFEDAAVGAAKLSQAFGMNVDAMKMMQEQDPAARLSMMQKAFKETGRSIESMTRQEKKLLAQQSGLDDEAAALAFSQKGLSMSYDQVQKAGAKSEKKQLTQAEAMSKLADAMERVFDSGGGGKFKSFFEAFTSGFESGIMRSKEFREVTKAIGASMNVVFKVGREVGKMFMALFPGIRETATALGQLFSPKRYRDLMGKVKNLFFDFFKDLKTDPKAGVEKFIDRFKKIFTDFFKDGGKLSETVLAGGKTILMAFWDIFKAVLPIAIKGLIDLMNLVTGFLKQKSGPMIDPAIFEMLRALVNTMIDLISVMWEKLWPPMKEMLITIFEKVKPWLMSAAPWLIGAALVKVILTGLMSAAWGAVTGWLSKKLLKIFTGAGETGSSSLLSSIKKIFSEGLPKLAEKIGTMTTEFLGPSISGALGRVGSMLSRLAGPVAIAAAIGTMGVTISKSTEKMGARLTSSFGKTAMQMGISASSIIDAITLGLLPDSLIEDIAVFTAKITSKMWKFLESILPSEAIAMFQAKINISFETLRGIGDIILGVFDMDITKISKGFGKIFDAIINELVVFTINLPKLVFKGILMMGEFLFKGLVKVLTWVLTDGFFYLLEGLAGLVTLLAGFGQFLIDKIVEVAEFFARLWVDPQFRQKMIDTAWNLGRDIVMGIVNGLWNFGTMVGTTLYDAWATFRDYWSEKIGPDGVRAIKALIDKIIDKLVSFKDKFLEGFSSAWSAVTSFFSLSTLKKLGTFILEGILSVMLYFPTRMLSLAREGWDKFSEFFSLSRLVEFAEDFIDGITDKLFGMLPLKYEIIARLAWSSFGDFFSIDKLRGLGSAIVDGIMDGLSSLKDKFMGSVSDAWSAVTSFFGWNSPATEGIGLGKGIVDGITNGLQDIVPNMLDVFNTVFEKLVDATQEGMKLVVNAITTSLSGIKNVLTSSGIIQAIVSTLGSISDTFVQSFVRSFRTVISIASTGLENIRSVLQLSNIGSSAIDSMRNFARGISSIIDELGRVSSPNFNIVENVKALGNTFSELSAQFARLENDPNLALAVKVGKGLSGRGTVQVKQEAVNITLNVNVNMSAEQLGKGLIVWSDTPPVGSQRRFATENRATQTVPTNLNAPAVGTRV